MSLALDDQAVEPLFDNGFFPQCRLDVPITRRFCFGFGNNFCSSLAGEQAVLRLNKSDADRLNITHLTKEVVNDIALAGIFFTLDLCSEPNVILWGK